MAQQINLHTPLLLATPRRFSARTMAQALALLAGGLTLLGVWLALQQRHWAQQAAETSARRSQEAAQLRQAVDAARRQRDPQALSQALEAAEREQRDWERQLQAQEAAMLPLGQGHAALLAWLPATLPAPVWVTAVHADPQGARIEGATLDLVALQAWLLRLDPPALGDSRALRTLRVRLAGVEEGDGPAFGMAQPTPVPVPAQPRPAVPTWRFSFELPRLPEVRP